MEKLIVQKLEKTNLFRVYTEYKSIHLFQGSILECKAFIDLRREGILKL